MIHISLEDQILIEAIQDGLPLVARPYAEIGQRIGMEEEEVINRLKQLLNQGVIRRMGIVIKHRKLGYVANAMVVWDIPDEQESEIGQCFSQVGFITLCYLRPRCLPQWPYNLFCMIHGKSRDTVLDQIDWLRNEYHLEGTPHEVLFSRRCFKQRGAIYRTLN